VSEPYYSQHAQCLRLSERFFTAAVVITTSIILSSNKIQNEDILVLANPGPPENGR